MKEGKLDKLRRKVFGAGLCMYVDPIGTTGGIVLWWKPGIQIDVCNFSKNFLDVNVRSGPHNTGGFITFIYGSSRVQDKSLVLEEIRKFDPGGNIPWLCIGDLNDVLFAHEKFGGRTRSRNSLRCLQEFVFDCRLMDLGFKGSVFTWTNNQLGNDNIMERLDRGLCNLSCRNLHPNAIIKHLEFIGSDHCPLLLLFNCCDKKTPRSFKFESMWVTHDEFDDVVKHNWTVIANNGSYPLDVFLSNISHMKLALSSWSGEASPNNLKAINVLMDELRICNGNRGDENCKMKSLEIIEKVEALWDKEEMYWAQRSRVQWIKCGDRNSRFFHSSTIQRRERNKISRIQNSSGEWLDKEVDIGGCFKEHFVNLFQASEERL